MALRLDFAVVGEFSTAMKEHQDNLARAATATMRDVADLAKKAGRQAIAAGGFGTKWQNAFQAKVFPANKNSLDAAAFTYEKISYAGVFETGATITGKKGLLWLPLPSATVLTAGRRITPAKFEQTIGPLILIHPSGKKPMLGAYIRATDARFAKPLTRGQLKRGFNVGGRGTLRFVPLFIGVPQVTDPKKFDVRAAMQTVAARIPELYAKNLRG